jgi:hypothetical protein
MRPRCQAGVRWLGRPGSISTGCDSNERNGREHGSGAAQRRAATLAALAALAALQAQ